MGTEELNLEDQVHILECGKYYYSSVSLRGNAKLYIDGMVMVYCSSVSIEDDSQIEVINGALLIYCEEFKQSGNSLINKGEIEDGAHVD